MTHPFKLPEDLVQSYIARHGTSHPYGRIDAKRTAMVVIDMQYYFMGEAYPTAAPMAREIVPNINRLATAVRAAGGRVIWVQNSSKGTDETWTVLHDHLLNPAQKAKRLEQMNEVHEGYRLWPTLEVKAEDDRIVKKRYSAFIRGSSPIEELLNRHGIDTILMTGVSTNVCCESSARDAMMLDFKVAMISDACAASSDAFHQAALNGFYRSFGDVLTVDEAIQGMSAVGKAAAE